MKDQTEKQSETRRQTLELWESIKTERSTWWPHWQDLSSYLLPRRSKFFSGQKQTGAKANDNIINSVATYSVRTLAAGMMSGITSPARQWFRLTVDGADDATRSWLDTVETLVLRRMGKSNLYTSLQALYPDMAVFSQAPLYVEEDVKDVFRTYVVPLGTYCLANNDRLQVDTLYREVVMTTKQLVQKFGEDAVSSRVRDLYKRHQLLDKHVVIHAVEPNPDVDPRRADALAKPFRSLWLEKECESKDGFLRQGGFEEFPYMVPRWEVTAEEAYGNGPGMLCLGDVKALQQYERRKAQLVDKAADPPMVGPASLENGAVNLLPGEVTYVPMGAGDARLVPAIEVNPSAVNVVTEAIREHETRIKQGFFADLWLMLAESDQQMTATEVNERHQEKMLQLGPVMERLEQELLNPLVLRVLGIMARRGLLPKPPPSFAGKTLRIEYTSIMADAQQLVRSQRLDALNAAVGRIAGAVPAVLDKIDFDKVVDEYAESYGLDGTVLRSEDDVQALRQARAQQQQAQAQLNQNLALAQGAKTLSQANTGGDNALTSLMGGVPGVGGLSN